MLCNTDGKLINRKTSDDEDRLLNRIQDPLGDLSKTTEATGTVQALLCISGIINNLLSLHLLSLHDFNMHSLKFQRRIFTHMIKINDCYTFAVNYKISYCNATLCTWKI